MKAAWQVGEAGTVFHSIDELRRQLLTTRGIDAEASENFFAPQLETSFHAPHLLAGSAAAAARIRAVKQAGERVLVWGDYDADGITATAILVSVLWELGVAVTPYLPHRADDGYALNRAVLENLLPHFDVLISADCGVSNGDEIAWLRDQGKDVIVVDHHELPAKLPDANAILHPRLGKYPFPHLSGAGVAWKLAQALLGDRARDFLDLAALGTIADVVPLTGENRAIVKFGLQRLSASPRLGLRALARTCRLDSGHDLSVEDAAFRLIPRLNAAGRMDHPQPALDLLLTQDEFQAEQLAQKLQGQNHLRQTATRRVLAEAAAGLDLALPFVFSANLDWGVGIVGLAAGRLSEQYARPAIVVGGNGRHAVGSARAPAGANVLELLETGRHFLSRLGGHTRAAGFSLASEDIADFRAALITAASPTTAETSEVIHVDAELECALISWDLVDLVESFAPYGEGNRKPRFLMRGLSVLDTRLLGKAKEHLKLILGGHGEPLEAIGFRKAKEAPKVNALIDVVGAVEVNEYRGQRRLQLVIEDLAPAGGNIV